MPPGTLDMLTIRDRVVDGIAAFEEERNPKKPGFVTLEQYLRPGTKNSRDIQGFSSDQL